MLAECDPLEQHFKRLTTFVEIADKARGILSSEADDDTKRELIFSDDIQGRLEELGIKIDDLETLFHEERLERYVTAVSSKADQLRTLLAPASHPFSEQERAFLSLADEARRIVDNEQVGWETKFDLIFDGLSAPIAETGISFDCYVPDTSYEEDVMGYVRGLSSKAQEIRAAFS